MQGLPSWSSVASYGLKAVEVLFSLHKSHIDSITSICIDNVEAIIIIAMARHIGLYLELTFNEGSQLRYHLKRGTSV